MHPELKNNTTQVAENCFCRV